MSKRIDEMTLEELRACLLVDDLTGLPNRRAFDESQAETPAPFVAMSDSDELLVFHDRFGREAGARLLRSMAEVFKLAGLDAYHHEDDMFRFKGKSAEELRAKFERARSILRTWKFDARERSGQAYEVRGVDFSYGIAKFWQIIGVYFS